MKRTAIILSLLSLVLSPAWVHAEEGMPQDEGRERMGKAGKMGGMMHQQPSVTATTDGGVVVLAGPKLLKYDAQLNLVGEAELKMGPKPGSRKGEAKPEEMSQAPAATEAELLEAAALEEIAAPEEAR